MKRVFLFVPILLLAFCKTPQPGTSRNAALPGHGAIAIEVIPNPIVAQNGSGNTYDFPFDVVVRETAGRPVTISRVSVAVYGPAGVKMGEESWDAPRIAAAGFSTNVPGNGELRYHFAPRKSVPTDIFSVRGEVRVDAYDDTSTPASATTVVTVTK